MTDTTSLPVFKLIERDMHKAMDTFCGALNLYLFAYGNGDIEKIERLKTIYPFLRGDNE